MGKELSRLGGRGGAGASPNTRTSQLLGLACDSASLFLLVGASELCVEAGR